MSFVDSSALVALIAPEPEGQALAQQLQLEPLHVTSPLVMFETVLALCRIRQAPIEEMTFIVHDFLARARISVEPVEADTYLTALQAFDRYGKGSGHPARLNFGDCFSYATARRFGVSLIYKGDDFSHTDIG